VIEEQMAEEREDRVRLIAQVTDLRARVKELEARLQELEARLDQDDPEPPAAPSD
jgi:BMFP domain-containing protein YqiC